MDIPANNEVSNLTKIDNMSDDILDKIKDFNIKISRLSDLWTTFEAEHTIGRIFKQSQELVKMFQMVTNEGEAIKKHGRYLALPEVQMDILVKIYKLWVTSKSEEYLLLLLKIFPQDAQDKCLLKFLNRANGDVMSVFNDVKSVCRNPSMVKSKIRHKSKIRKIIDKLPRFFKLSSYVRGMQRAITKNRKKPLVQKLRRMGFSNYMANNWVGMVFADLWKKTGYRLAQKKWCYKHGFFPHRFSAYFITKANYKSFLSDRDYCYLHPINNDFKKWINDNVSPRYILAPFKEHFTKCYFHLLVRNKKILVVPLVDCPEGYEASYDGILQLLRDKGDLAFKTSSGDNNNTFKKLSYRDGCYFVNNQFCHGKDIIRIFNTIEQYFIITEYVMLHRDLKVIYPESANTVSMLIVNKDGVSPLIGHTCMRIGTSLTGITDNITSGGVVVKVDIETGRYYDGESIINNKNKPCSKHPDTGVSLEGFLPHWDFIKEQVLAMCKYIPQLEYMRFDIAITDNGFVVVEISDYQDLYRFRDYNEQVQQFFWKKLERKYERNKNHIDKYKRTFNMIHEFHDFNAN